MVSVCLNKALPENLVHKNTRVHFCEENSLDPIF